MPAADLPVPSMTMWSARMMAVMIGVDPDKGSHTAVAVGPQEQPLGKI
jgi:hypothetical protein